MERPTWAETKKASIGVKKRRVAAADSHKKKLLLGLKIFEVADSAAGLP